MKNYILGLIIIVSAFTFYSCNPPGRVYKTIAIDDIISQVPVSLKGKRDLSIQADISFYTPSQTETFSKLLNTDVRYEFNSATALSIASQYAVSNQFSLGLKYIGEQDYTGEYTSHNITGTVNFFKNFPTKNKNVQFGYDVLGGFQYKTARNYMTVDEYYLDSTPKPDQENDQNSEDSKESQKSQPSQGQRKDHKERLEEDTARRIEDQKKDEKAGSGEGKKKTEENKSDEVTVVLRHRYAESSLPKDPEPMKKRKRQLRERKLVRTRNDLEDGDE